MTLGTTPGRYRLWSLVAGAVLVVTAAAGAYAAVHMRSVTEQARDNTGPVLVATQGLVASLAEADAAATAAFLSGRQEDREQRRLYEQALGRAHAQIEDVASLAGDDPVVHDALGSLLVDVSRYAGLVEAARASLRGGLPNAEQSLVEALGVLGGAVDRHIGSITERMQARFDEAQRDRSDFVDVAGGLGMAAVAVLVAAQVMLVRRTRRLLNLPLVLATLAVVAAIGWLVVADRRAATHLEDARRHGYESIALTARIQALGNEVKTTEALGAITGRPVTVGATVATTEELLREAATRADTPREDAAAAELLVRWQRYRQAADRARAGGPLTSAFNGFNYTVESVLADNRDQFVEGLSDADDAQGGLLVGLLALPLLAMAAQLAGFQVRINEYR